MAKAKLLLVEDDVTLSKMYEKKFKTEGYDVEVAYDGLDGLDKAVKGKPDLVVLDIMLPKMDGLSVFKKMRSTPDTFKTPVLLLTNFDQEDTVFECFKLGAVDYLLKSSVTPKQVVEKVGNLLKGIEGPITE
ncbi:TPA: response regulator [Candidatus Berkelbacteria bacterium]|uniref:Alkaline phosphatase synthesis transcriptional regulatory protein phoP, two-component system, OmpR family, alkaline phosphatase synthesis response regulator PhoP n=1 Tax=Berkelbacteria bacterium GW2011_GWE1_39_12 TaxID=1618337 RepID=A0A0G4B4L1_9BACT|nr:MAG: Alkaline phosphatase synthesis transcriptional regulatory protein phoP, two-component system, OmpR family, alkaline phosphatase synthesis response regulator PhoP [Berkelbacteria bacterium GW2011_GWE1_39_12]HBO60929.1 response regulator [Candidatus Berkelbacteria bacterium]